MAASTPISEAEQHQAFDLVMRSAVSTRNDVHYGRFQSRAQADAVGELLLAADAIDSPEWDRFDVEQVPVKVLAWTDGHSAWLIAEGLQLGPCTLALVDADAMTLHGQPGRVGGPS